MLKKTIDGVNRAAEALMAVGMFAMLFLVVVQIGSRLLNHSFPWSEEVTRYIFIWLTFLGMTAGVKDVEHPRVTLFFRFFPNFIRKASWLIYFWLCLFFFLVTAFYGIFFTQQQILSREMAYAIQIPLWIIGLSVPASALLSVINLGYSVFLSPEGRRKLEM